MKTQKEFITVEKLVLTLLEKDERARNDDKYLTVKVMQHFIDFPDLTEEQLKRIPAFETIKRCRAKIQNTNGWFKPTDARVLELRGHRAEDIRQWATTGPLDK